MNHEDDIETEKMIKTSMEIYYS